MPLAGSVSTSFAPNARSTARRSGLIDSGMVRMHVVALHGRDERERDAGVAAGRLDDHAHAGLDQPVALGRLDHREADAILDAVRGVRGSRASRRSRGLHARATRLSRTSGVRPISSVASRAIFTGFSWIPCGWPGRGQHTPLPCGRDAIVHGAEQLLDEHRRVAARRQLEAQRAASPSASSRAASGRTRSARRAPRSAHARRQPQRVGIEPCAASTARSRCATAPPG